MLIFSFLSLLGLLDSLSSKDKSGKQIRMMLEIHGRPRHPQSNGTVERCIQTVVDRFRKQTQQYGPLTEVDKKTLLFQLESTISVYNHMSKYLIILFFPV